MLGPSTSSEQRAATEICVEEGALSQGDRDPEPFTTYLVFTVTPVGNAAPALARFQGGVELVGAAVRKVDQGVNVELRWYSTASIPDDYVIFVHYLQDEQRIAQDDAMPAGGRYPTSLWQIGDLICDNHLIHLPNAPDPNRDQIRLGFYRSGDDQRLDLLDHAGNPAGTYLTLPVGAIETP
jgi:hypothetical protein